MEIYTIGFTQKTAEQFFGILEEAHVCRLLDIRLNNSSQLAGFSKGHDLSFFLKRLLGIDYIHVPELAPTQELLSRYRRDHDWAQYELEFRAILARRRVERFLDRGSFESSRTVLLCSEPTAERCHRRLVVEYLAQFWGEVSRVDL